MQIAAGDREIIKLWLIYENNSLEFSAFILKNEYFELGGELSKNSADGVNALAYLCVCQAMHEESGQAGYHQLGSKDTNSAKLSKAISNHTKWLASIENPISPKKIMTNHGDNREPRIALSEEVAVVVEIVLKKGERRASHVEMQMFRDKFKNPKSIVTTLMIEVAPHQGGSIQIYKENGIEGGLWQGDYISISASINRSVFASLIWINGNGIAELLYPEDSRKIPSIFSNNDGRTLLKVPRAGRLKITSDDGFEICCLLIADEVAQFGNLERLIEDVQEGWKFASEYATFNPKLVYSSSFNNGVPEIAASTNGRMGLEYEKDAQNLAEVFLMNIKTDLMASRAIILPNLTNLSIF